MAEVRLAADKRPETGKGSARRTRAAGRVPGVLYGQGMDPVSLSVDRRELVTALHSDAGMNVLLDIDIDGATTLALTKHLDRDPVRGTLLHADFIKVDRTQEVHVEIPLHFIGEAPGSKEGGVVDHPLFQLHVSCLPGDVPESIEVDISSLNIGDSLRVQDLSLQGSYSILDDPESVVVSVVAPISEAELESDTEGTPTEVTEEGGDVAADGTGDAEGSATAEE
jgi:large subunit ribosomal protein L25